MKGTPLTTAAADQTLSTYMAQIRRIPLLDAQEESILATRWRQHGDRAAVDRLVTSHLRLVAKIAWGYRGYGLPMSDLVSEGTLGMLEAAKRFDPERGFRLSSFATWWVRAHIQDYALRSWSLVRVGTTANQKKLFFKLRRLRAQLRALDDGDLSPEDVQFIAVDLGVPAAEVIAMNRRLLSRDASLNSPLPDNDAQWQDQLVDESSDQESTLAEREASGRRRTLLHDALALLEPRERTIVEARRLRDEPTSRIALATRFRVTTGRIRQIECTALAKLNKLVRDMSRSFSSPAPHRQSQTATDEIGGI